MILVLLLLMLCLLFRADLTMSAASAACRLFVTSVLPGLFPYMVLSQMLISRMKRLSPALVMALGWGGGSPTGAKLTMMSDFPPRARARLLLSTATMSPMFLLGTVGGWLGSSSAGAVVLGSVILSGWITGQMARFCTPGDLLTRMRGSSPQGGAHGYLSFGAAVEASARTMLLVCGTMVMLRVCAALAAEALPHWAMLPVTTLLEVTTGVQAIAALLLPLPWRTALIAGAAGFGGFALLLQNRAVSGDVLPLPQQLLWQAVHGAMAFLLALGTMLMWKVC